MDDVREDVIARLLVLVHKMEPEQAREVLAFAEQIAARSRAREGVLAAFGIWRDRQDMQGDSVELVRSMRNEWESREERLGLA